MAEYLTLLTIRWAVATRHRHRIHHDHIHYDQVRYERASHWPGP